MFQILAGCRDAKLKPLALGFSSTYRAPSPRILTLANSFNDFRTTYEHFVEILNRKNSSIEFREDFRHTWDECNDFLLHDYETLRHDGATFEKRRPTLPAFPYRVARYVYTDAEIVRLERRVELLFHIMHAKMDDIVLSVDVPLPLER
jgi:hypothetical protein